MSNPLIYVIDAFNDNIKGNVKFTEDFMKCKIEINLAGLKPNSLRRFHVNKMLVEESRVLLFVIQKQILNINFFHIELKLKNL